MGLIDKVDVVVNGAQDSSKALVEYNTVILKQNIRDSRNMLTQQMMSQMNTKYVIKWAYTLAENIVLPKNCLIEFDGGSIKNDKGNSYTLTGDDTILIYSQELEDVVKGVELEGTFIHKSCSVADEEDLTVEHSDLLGIDTLKLANRDNKNGMGYIILRRNKSFAEQVIKENTIYEIRYDFDLNGQEITIPEGCVLDFQGGSLRNGNVSMNSTKILEGKTSDILFDRINLRGKIINKEFESYWIDNIHCAFQICYDSNTKINLYSDIVLTPLEESPVYIPSIIGVGQPKIHIEPPRVYSSFVLNENKDTFTLQNVNITTSVFNDLDGNYYGSLIKIVGCKNISIENVSGSLITDDKTAKRGPGLLRVESSNEVCINNVTTNSLIGQLYAEANKHLKIIDCYGFGFQTYIHIADCEFVDINNINCSNTLEEQSFWTRMNDGTSYNGKDVILISGTPKSVNISNITSKRAIERAIYALCGNINITNVYAENSEGVKAVGPDANMSENICVDNVTVVFNDKAPTEHKVIYLLWQQEYYTKNKTLTNVKTIINHFVGEGWSFGLTGLFNFSRTIENYYANNVSLINNSNYRLPSNVIREDCTSANNILIENAYAYNVCDNEGARPIIDSKIGLTVKQLTVDYSNDNSAPRLLTNNPNVVIYNSNIKLASGPSVPSSLILSLTLNNIIDSNIDIVAYKTCTGLDFVKALSANCSNIKNTYVNIHNKGYNMNVYISSVSAKDSILNVYSKIDIDSLEQGVAIPISANISDSSVTDNGTYLHVNESFNSNNAEYILRKDDVIKIGGIASVHTFNTLNDYNIEYFQISSPTSSLVKVSVAKINIRDIKTRFHGVDSNLGILKLRENVDFNKGVISFNYLYNRPVMFLSDGSFHFLDGSIPGLRVGNSSEMPENPTNAGIGIQYFNNEIKLPCWWNGNKWIDAFGNLYDAKRSGTFSEKPDKPTVGFSYFCTDRQTTEGTTNGIMIYHKGERVWVDALGRIVE